jgi:hypothetical protein
VVLACVCVSEQFAAYPRTPMLFICACRVPESSVAVSPDFKRFAKWRISASLVSWRISDVKAESKLT